MHSVHLDTAVRGLLRPGWLGRKGGLTSHVPEPPSPEVSLVLTKKQQIPREGSVGQSRRKQSLGLSPS